MTNDQYIEHEIKLRVHENKFKTYEDKLNKIDLKLNGIISILICSIGLPMAFKYLGW